MIDIETLDQWEEEADRADELGLVHDYPERILDLLDEVWELRIRLHRREWQVTEAERKFGRIARWVKLALRREESWQDALFEIKRIMTRTPYYRRPPYMQKKMDELLRRKQHDFAPIKQRMFPDD